MTMALAHFILSLSSVQQLADQIQCHPPTLSSKERELFAPKVDKFLDGQSRKFNLWKIEDVHVDSRKNVCRKRMEHQHEEQNEGSPGCAKEIALNGAFAHSLFGSKLSFGQTHSCFSEDRTSKSIFPKGFKDATWIGCKTSLLSSTSLFGTAFAMKHLLIPVGNHSGDQSLSAAI